MYPMTATQVHMHHLTMQKSDLRQAVHLTPPGSVAESVSRLQQFSPAAAALLQVVYHSAGLPGLHKIGHALG